MSAIQALEQWCRSQCDGYRDVNITNMTTSFRSGLAFCALIHKHRPDLIDYDSLRMEDVFDNNKLRHVMSINDHLAEVNFLRASCSTETIYKTPTQSPGKGNMSLAFQVAEEELGIPALLDAEDMVALRIPDRLSILTYVSQYYNYFKVPQAKKNLPVAPKASATKPAVKNQAPSPVASQMSPKVAKADSEEPNSNKSGTLNSKCVTCKGHVHLVQRHFVDGKLFHRRCFICCECSGTLHAGGYKAGKKPDTFVCRVHPEKASEPSTGAQVKPAASLSENLIGIQPAPSCKPVQPVPPTQCWTTSAQKTQAARQNFLQAAPPPPAAFPQWPQISTRKKLAEQNCNNNNKRPFTIRSAERRFGGESSPAESSTAPKVKSSKNPAKNFPPEAIKCSNARPPTDADPPPKCQHVESKAEAPREDAESAGKEHQYDFVSTSFSSVPLSPAKKKSEPSGQRSPVKSTTKWPATESIRSPTCKGDVLSGAKKGKYLSPTNAPGAEMRSPSPQSYHIPVERIENELDQIEKSLVLLEREGVELERKLRRCEEEGGGDLLMDPLMVDWFKLIRKKQMFIRKESELVYTARTQELERQQPRVEQELRRLLEKPDHVKSSEERAREKMLMCNLMEIVNGRNAIVKVLDDDRLRELAEDEQLNTMMTNLGGGHFVTCC
ncbi:MICAL-like protein 2a isoform X2 [Syngnathus typhle]|uniref:MICAL-like protein 2a isoform X2 n=1 Tax=Syngnathus typhle TaxID=161592 RepID=UPI002A6B08DB|nr:MICAL-like protein 2a isoform X2 [Syngnathus typhle]